MDIYTRFDLPPPPPPTIFSRDHSDARARMPNFSSVKEVSDFVDGSRLWRHGTAANGFLIFATAYLLVVSFFAVYVMSHKLYKRCFWVFRVVPRGHSNVIIPNVHTSFALFITPFLLVLAASSLALIAGHARNEPSIRFGLWVSVMWVPVVFAVWYQVWGLLAARLGDGSISSRKGNNRSLFRLVPAWLVNVVCLLLPAIPSIPCAVLGAVADSYYGHARTGWFEWHSQYDGTSDLTRDMVLDAQNIFHSSIHGAYYLSICLALWSWVCLFNTAAHCYATTTLIYNIGTHLRSKRRGLPMQSFKPDLQPAVPAVNLPAGIPLDEMDKTDSNSQSCAVSATSSRPALLSFSRDSGNRQDDQGQIKSRMFTSEERRQDKSVSFFPSIIPSATVVSLETSKATVVLAFFTLQSASITFGGLAFFADGMYMAVRLFAGTEANDFQRYWQVGYYLIVTITLLAGTGSVISLAHTTFEDSVATLLFMHGGRSSTVAENSGAVDEEDLRNTNFLDMEQTRDLSAHRFS